MNRDSQGVLRASEPKAFPRLERLPQHGAPADHRASLDRATLALFVLCLVIGVVSAYDVYLSIKYQHLLLYQELNPVGVLLLRADDGSVATFMGMKFLGTLLAIVAIQSLFHYQRRLGLSVAGGVAGVQGALGVYLLFG